MPPAPPPPTDNKPKKLQRISQACDLCHRRSIRCRPSAENPQQQCQNCYDFAVECTYNRPSKRRRQPSTFAQTEPSTNLNPPNILLSQRAYPPSASDHHGTSSRSTTAGPAPTHDPAMLGLSHFTSTANGNVDLTGAYVSIREQRSQQSVGTAWRSFALASASTVEQYLELYEDVVYPMCPVFHLPTLWERVRKQHHIMDRGFFASVMAACALVAARARDGAAGERFEFDDNPEKSSETFFAAARDAIMLELHTARNVGFLRACALLALTAVQYGQIETMQMFAGHYATLAATMRFHDEESWPTTLTAIDKEERRRLFWTMYRFDIYAAVVFHGPITAQEVQSNVRYPLEISDEDLARGSGTQSDDECWLRGFNFATDLARITEHAVTRRGRRSRPPNDRIPLTGLMVAEVADEAQIMDNVMGLYYRLPGRFQEYRVPMTGDRRQDLLGFQAVALQTALSMVRMTLCTGEGASGVGQKCAVAEQALSILRSIAPQWLQMMSTPLVYHLGSIGQILGSVMEGPLSEESYRRVRTLLVALAELLAEFEQGLQPSAGASKNIHNQIQLIDQYMEAQRRLMPVGPSEAGSIPTSGESRTVVVPQAQIPGGGGLRMHNPIDEYQLPHEMVNDGAWPWPFQMAQQEHPHNSNMVYPSWQDSKNA